MKPGDSDTIKHNLKRHPLFSKLTDLQFERVSQFSHVQTLGDGQMLFHQADKVSAFYMVLNGKVKLFRMSPDGQEKIIEIVKSGWIFAEALMFSNQEDYPVSSAAITETSVIAINAHDFHDMLWDSTATCLLLLGDMSMRLRGLVGEIEKLTLHSGSCRVASYLVQEIVEGKKEIELDVAKNIIAARLSIKPETFSRIIKRFKDQDVLSIEGNCVTIHDLDKLKKMSMV